MIRSMSLVLIMLLISTVTLSFNIYVHSIDRLANRSTIRSMSMKKGKGSKVPINQRGEYMKQQKMYDMQSQMQKNKPTGVPVFKVFVRPKSGGLWLPCGDLSGDSRSTALVNAWQSGFMSDMYKNQLDQGVALSIFSQEGSFAKNVVENYKPFKKCTVDDIQFGYKVEFEGLDEKFPDQKVTLLERGMEKGWFDNLKEKVASIF